MIMNLAESVKRYEFTSATREVLSALRSEGFVVSRPVVRDTADEYKIQNNGGD